MLLSKFLLNIQWMSHCDDFLFGMKKKKPVRRAAPRQKSQFGAQLRPRLKTVIKLNTGTGTCKWSKYCRTGNSILNLEGGGGSKGYSFVFAEESPVTAVHSRRKAAFTFTELRNIYESIYHEIFIIAKGRKSNGCQTCKPVEESK